MKTYNLKCGITCIQDELNLEQDHDIAELILSLKDTSLAKLFEGDLANIKIMDVILLLKDNNLIQKLLAIVLLKENLEKIPEEDFNKIKNSELMEVLTDFFNLNPKLVGLLTSFGKGLASQIQNSMSSATETTATD